MLATSFVLTKRPKEYLKQGFTHCGAYSVKGILSAYGKDTKKHPKEYHIHWLHKATGSGLTPQYYVEVLSKNGIKSEGKYAKGLTYEEQIFLLKGALSRNRPIMLVIGNGYDEEGHYDSVRSFFQGHWITLWGYEDKSKLFYVYDSCVPTSRYDKNIPIGNTTRTYKEIARDWKGSITTKLLGFKPFYYIEVKGNIKYD